MLNTAAAGTHGVYPIKKITLVIINYSSTRGCVMIP